MFIQFINIFFRNMPDFYSVTHVKINWLIVNKRLTGGGE